MNGHGPGMLGRTGGGEGVGRWGRGERQVARQCQVRQVRDSPSSRPMRVGPRQTSRTHRMNHTGNCRVVVGGVVAGKPFHGHHNRGMRRAQASHASLLLLEDKDQWAAGGTTGWQPEQHRRERC